MNGRTSFWSKMSKTRDLVKNTLIIAVGKVSTQFLSLLLLPLYTIYLSAADYGSVDLITTYVILAAPLLTIQSEMAVFRFLVDARSDTVQAKQIITNTLQIALGGVLIATTLYLLTSIFITIPFGLLALGMVIASIFSGFFMQVARGLGDNVKFAVAGIIAGIVGIVANVTFIVFMDMGVTGVLFAGIIANAAAAMYLFASLRLYRYIDLKQADWQLKKHLLGYSAPLVPNGVSWWVINAADRTIVTIVLGVASNGIYAIAYKFPAIFNSLYSFFGMSWTESASMHINSKDRDSFFSETMNMSLKVFGSIGLAMIVAVPFIFTLLINHTFAQAADYVPILIIGAFFNSVVGLYSAIYIAKKMTKQVMNTSLIAVAISIVATVALIKWLGLFAPAVAMTLAFLSMAIFRHYDLKKYIRITYQRSILLTLGLMYGLVLMLYYINNPIIDLLNLGLVAVFMAVYNKQGIAKLISKISGGRKLSSDQRAAEIAQEASEFSS